MEKVMKIWARVITIISLIINSLVLLLLLLTQFVGGLIGGPTPYDSLPMLGLFMLVPSLALLILLLDNLSLIPLFYYSWTKPGRRANFFKSLAKVFSIFLIIFLLLKLLFYFLLDPNIWGYSDNWVIASIQDFVHIMFIFKILFVLQLFHIPVFYYAWRKEPAITDAMPTNNSNPIDNNTIKQ